ncbi:hypothetical protein DES53_103443 [Roseimicrobium gellanilyticum]|uniref:Uncharacterized protein n=1 Tax=Roseimicrobium gellanilyticum TaxID=748857 RepID=A0A366HR96_9BACT|nr:hypothetical protein [Roseimicrobium gellanilyticum]RBP45443.1 hypothetical protein DES53_103443 [Roseimicrobium gellanilyticum]
MGFLSNLFDVFKKGEDPDSIYTDEVLGVTHWSDEDESWHGEYRGLKFSLDYERLKKPSDAVVAFAREVLEVPEFLVASVATEKDKEKVSLTRHGDIYAAEVDGLTIGEIHFYLHKGKRRMFIGLEGGRDYRVWRIEYADRTCEGMGFDS